MAVRRSRDEMRVVLIGNTGVGKSSIVKMATIGVFSPDSVPTLGASHAEMVVQVEGGPIKLHLWDISGEERFKGIASLFLRNVDVAVLVYSITDTNSFTSIDNWVSSLRELSGKDATIFLVGNKCDRKGKKAVKASVGKKKAEDLGAQFFKVSSKTDENIDNLFVAIAETRNDTRTSDEGVPKDPYCC
jgi:small GTP-binding protein